MSNIISVSLVDDDKLVVDLLKEFLDSQDNISVSITAFGGIEFIEKLKNADSIPHVVILDLKMKDGDGIEVIEQVTKNYPELKIIVLSSYYKASFLGYMLKIGVHAFVPKETDKFELLKIILDVHEKGHFFTSDQVEVVRQQVSNKAPILNIESKDALSEREIDVLQLICQQFTAKEIGDKLFISTKTVEAHKSNLLLKTGVRNTAGLIVYAVKNHIIDPSEIFLMD
ncbi:response regulator transcription factor [Bernardetia sp. Wsw4-3y2]|uniref:response regulator transcription factor n=1 Tax=Bernardetia sp. Wsw4-3y2 TaxID=3127471 RepID=UPI0030D3A435